MGHVKISLKTFWWGKSWEHVKISLRIFWGEKELRAGENMFLRIFWGEKELRAAGGSCSTPTGNYQHWLELHGATQPASITGTNTDTLTRTITRTLTGTTTRTTNTITQPTLHCQYYDKFCSSVIFTLGISSIILGVSEYVVYLFTRSVKAYHSPDATQQGHPINRTR